jgi:hypothetical protein
VIDGLHAALDAHGLVLLGGFHPEPADQVPGEAATVLMLGNVGSAIYPHLRASPEAALADPLDRWTRRVVGELAARLPAVPLFPFDGPPFHPFQRWARRADPRFAPSPLGLLIHEAFGLWAALRAALLLRERLDLPPVAAAASPCATCATRPCLATCPVGAFGPGHYDVAACRTHLGRPGGQACMTSGCLARHACPVGRAYAYSQAHAAFHMQAFRTA